MSITFDEPISHVRWMRVTCTENSSPVAYAAIRVFGYRGDSLSLSRTHSIVSARSGIDLNHSQQRPENSLSTQKSQLAQHKSQIRPQQRTTTSLFPETFELPGSQLTRDEMKRQQRAKRQSRSSFAIWHEAHRGSSLLSIAKEGENDENVCGDETNSDEEQSDSEDTPTKQLTANCCKIRYFDATMKCCGQCSRRRRNAPWN